MKVWTVTADIKYEEICEKPVGRGRLSLSDREGYDEYWRIVSRDDG